MYTQSPEQSDIYYAYSTFHHFFDVFGLQYACRHIRRSIVAAAGNKMWRDDVPARLLFFVEKLEGLCAAAFTIHYNFAERPGAIIHPEDGVPDIAATGNFLDSYYHSNAWNNFPRNLTAAQYNNPYKAIARFCNYMALPEWNRFFKDLIEYALSKSSINDDACPVYHILKIHLRLLQLVEAAHLLDVRTYKKELPIPEAGDNLTAK